MIVAPFASTVGQESTWVKTARSCLLNGDFSTMDDVLDNLLSLFAPDATRANLRNPLESLRMEKSQTLSLFCIGFLELVANVHGLAPSDPNFLFHVKSEAKHFYKGLAHDQDIVNYILKEAGATFEKLTDVAQLRDLCGSIDKHNAFLRSLKPNNKRIGFVTPISTRYDDSSDDGDAHEREQRSRLEAATLAAEEQAKRCAAITTRAEALLEQRQQQQERRQFQPPPRHQPPPNQQLRGQQRYNQSNFRNRNQRYQSPPARPSPPNDGRCHKCGYSGHVYNMCSTPPAQYQPGLPRDGRTGRPLSTAADRNIAQLNAEIAQLKLQLQQQQQPQPPLFGQPPSFIMRNGQTPYPRPPALMQQPFWPATGMVPLALPPGPGRPQQQPQQQMNAVGATDDDAASMHHLNGVGGQFQHHWC